MLQRNLDDHVCFAAALRVGREVGFDHATARLLRGRLDVAHRGLDVAQLDAHAGHFARREFFFLLIALMLGAVLVVVLLAGRLFRQTRPTVR